ncbi:hypothetical protein MRS44_018302 [Fusarium solani]|uniref:uncharacterized protein n=1 Tax=Fusarium solani TaxID=169388 RepID=UPI0032C43772|nr:hypothetical protein MRS44_018302 [Fusarium solani]
MLLGANLPEDLWPEAWKTAVYLHNRSPQQSNNWKTPFQQLHNWLKDNNRDTGYINQQPDVAHLKAYGCRAYPLTREAQQGTQKRALKTAAHAEVGYLVGYDSSNIFRIWIPERSEVRRVRDVTFNEQQLYDPKDHPDRLGTREPQPQQLLPSHIETDSEDEEIRSTIEVITDLVETDTEDLGYDEMDDLADAFEAAWPQRPARNLTSPSTSATAMEASPSTSATAVEASDQMDDLSGSPDLGQQPQPRKSQRIKDRDFRSSFFLGQQEKLHRRSLPPEPRTWRGLEGHRFEREFKQAADTQMDSLWDHQTFRPDPIDQATQRALPVTWVFKYKFDKHGFLQRFKARLCVRGDLQPFNHKETYAATLAGKSFRILMALTARFDLEARQLDAINAFTNSILDEEIFIKFPDGYERRGWILKLHKALYGLRRSPLLWQKDLTRTFQQLGLSQCAEDPCICNNSWVTVFFFVDDIVVLYQKKDKLAADQLINSLKSRYKMQDLGDLQWFLGIRVIRDRPARKLWLCQDSYIEAITARFKLDQKDHFKGSPFPTGRLQPNPGQATRDQVHLYQQTVGSINYAAVMTRLDIAHPVAKLAESLLNPSDRHQQAANQLIEYLFATRHLAIQFNGRDPYPRTTAGPSGSNGPLAAQVSQGSSPDLQIASDAAFADDPMTRKSSQGSIIILFGGPVSWKAGKQDTVTTSSTEAKLLAFTHTAKEAMAPQRLFK